MSQKWFTIAATSATAMYKNLWKKYREIDILYKKTRYTVWAKNDILIIVTHASISQTMKIIQFF